MPYVKPYDPAKQIETGAGAGPAPAGSAPAGPGGPAPTPQGQNSGAFVDFGRYLNANKADTATFANKIMGGLDSNAREAMGAAPTQPGHYEDDPATYSYTYAKPGDTPTPDGSPKTTTPNPVTQHFVKDGPVDPTAVNAARAKALGGLNSAAKGDTSQIIDRTRSPGSYTQGQSAFDAQLLGGSGVGKSISALRDRYAGLLQPYSPDEPSHVGSNSDNGLQAGGLQASSSALRTKKNTGLDW